jgi:hypothetical protein
MMQQQQQVDDTHSHAITNLHIVCKVKGWGRPIFDVDKLQQQVGSAAAVVWWYRARVKIHGVWYDGADGKATENAARVEAAVEALKALI